MSSREPMWYCHECNAEMRPLMVPDLHCASCNGTFVEKIENPADDPRQFGLADGGHWDEGPFPGDMDAFFNGLRSILRGPSPTPTRASTLGNPPAGPDPRRASGERTRAASEPQPGPQPVGRNGQFTVRIERSSTPGGRTRTVILGSPPGVGSGGNDDIPRLSQFAPPRPTGGTQQDRPNITGPLLAQYLLALMGPGRAGDPFSELMGGMFPGGMPAGGGESGRWGDYVFNQEALDQIISQIMENNNAHQPVPATEEAIEKLPREVLEQGSPLLEKDCAVCKEQFSLETEDPDEQVVISLPCQHPFHEPCILPWLKTSGTCPVCRYQLVPQPGSQPSGSGSGPRPPDASRPGSSPPRNASSSNGGSILHNVFNLFAGHNSTEGNDTNPSGTSRSTQTQSPERRSSGNTGSQTGQRSSQDHNDYDIPGGWADQVD